MAIEIVCNSTTILSFLEAYNSNTVACALQKVLFCLPFPVIVKITGNESFNYSLEEG